MSKDLPVPETRVLAIASHVGIDALHLRPSFLPANRFIEGRLWVSYRVPLLNPMPNEEPDMLAIPWQPLSCSQWAVKWLP